MSHTTVKRALISVSDKSGIIEFARALCENNVQILSTGGTFRLLQEEGIEVTEVASVTEFPEIMGGRVKTLHPKIHGGLLGRRGGARKHEHGGDQQHEDQNFFQHGKPPFITNIFSKV